MPIWDKFVYLAPFSGFTGAARLPIGRSGRIRSSATCSTPPPARSRRSPPPKGVTISADRFAKLTEYMDNIPPTTRSSLLIDLEMGKRIEVEALQGAALRRAARHGVPMPIISTLYSVLHAGGHEARDAECERLQADIA